MSNLNKSGRMILNVSGQCFTNLDRQRAQYTTLVGGCPKSIASRSLRQVATGPSKPLGECSQQEVAQPGDPRDSSEAPRKLLRSASDARNLLWSIAPLSVDLQRNYYIKNVGLFEENSILLFPECLESSGWYFLKVEVSQESPKNR